MIDICLSNLVDLNYLISKSRKDDKENVVINAYISPMII